MLKTKLKVLKSINKFKARKISEHTSKMPGKTSLLGATSSFIGKFLVIGIFGTFILFPFFYMLSASLMSFDEVKDKHTLNLVPKLANWDNFAKAMSQGYWRSLLLTAIVTFISIILKLFITMLMGYAFSLPRWRGKKILWLSLLSIMMLPEVALVSGQFRIVTELDWREGFMLMGSLTIPFVASVFSTLMFRNAFEEIPTRTKEAAMIDGVSNIKYFIKIAFPIVSPTTWTVGILTAFAAWNSYMWPNILLRSVDGKDVMSTWLFSTGLPDSDFAQQGLQIQIRLAAAILAILPVFIFYFLMRARIMRAISKQGSAIKG